MGRYSTPGLFFFSPSNLTAALHSGASRPMESVRATSRLGEIGTFEATYAYPLNHGSGYVAFGALEAVGNIAIIIYSDFNYPPGVQRSKMVGECYIIDNVKVEDRQAGGLQVSISGRSFLAELENKQVWEPVGDSTTYNTTLAVAVVAPNSSNSVGETAAGKTEIVVADSSIFFDTNMVLIPLPGGGTFLGLVSSVDSDTKTLTLDRPLPATIANGTTVTRRPRKLFLNNTEGFEVGAKVTITLNSGTFTTIVEEGETMEDVSGTERARILVRDGITGAANVNNAVVAVNKAKPTTTPYDDIAQILANAPGWTSDNTLMSPSSGTSHVPDGASVFDLLKAVSDITGIPFRQEVDPSNLRPMRKIKWGLYPSADDYGGSKITLENPPPSMMAQHLSKAHRGTIHGTISREYRDNKVTRIYPTGGDAGVTLMGVSAATRTTLAGMGFIIVDNPATLGLYEPPYMYNSALEPAEKISRRVTFGDITAETSGSTTWMYACDNLAWQSARWLMSRTRAYWEWRITDVDVSSPAIPRAGTTFALTRYFDPQMDKSAFPATYTWENVDDLIAREVTMRWDVKRQIPLYDFVLSDAANDPTDSAPTLVSQFQNYDMVARRVGQGKTDRASTIAYTAPAPPGGGGGGGAFLPLAGGTMTGNIAFSGTQTVDGVDISAHAANASAHHAPVTAGNTGISVAGQAVSVFPRANGGLEVNSGLRIKAGRGVGTDNDGIYLNPSQITLTSTNTPSGPNHSHGISAWDNTIGIGGAVILKSTEVGGLSLEKLGVGNAADSVAALVVRARATTNYGLWIKQLASQTHDIWRVDDSAGNPLLRMTGAGHFESGTPAYVSGQVGWRIWGGTASGDAEFNNIRVRGELHATTFVADEMHAVNGTVLVKTNGKVAAPRAGQPNDNKIPAINSSFSLIVQAGWDGSGLNYLPVGSIVRIKPMGEIVSGGSLDLFDLYCQVTAVSGIAGRDLANGQPGYYVLTCTFRHGGTFGGSSGDATGFVIPTGSAAIKWTEVGASGFTGAIKLSGDGDFSNVAEPSTPFIDIFTVNRIANASWAGVPPTILPRVRVGNLTGVLGGTRGNWGIAAGTDLSNANSTTAQYFAASDTGLWLHNVGIRIFNGANQTVDISSDGNMRLGTNVTTNANRTFAFAAADGSLRLGPLADNSAYMLWNGTDLRFVTRVGGSSTSRIVLDSSGNSYFAGPMTIGTDGGIWQGTGGTFASPQGGLKIWNVDGAARLALFTAGGAQQITLRHDRGLEMSGSLSFPSSLTFAVSPGGTIYGGLRSYTSGGESISAYTVTDGSTVSGISMSTGAAGIVRLLAGNSEFQMSSSESYARLSGVDFYVENGGIAVGHNSTPSLARGVIASDLAGAHDNPIMVWQDTTDIAHGMTNIASTGTFGNVRKADNAQGGLAFNGLTEAVRGLQLNGYGTTASSTKASGSLGTITLTSRVKSGADAGALGTNDNLLVVRNHETTRFIIDGDGDFYYDGTGAAFDDHDDVGLLRVLSRELWRGTIDSVWDRFITVNRRNLIDAGVMSEGGFINGAALNRLLTGAIWQLNERLSALEERLK